MSSSPSEKYSATILDAMADEFRNSPAWTRRLKDANVAHLGGLVDQMPISPFDITPVGSGDVKIAFTVIDDDENVIIDQSIVLTEFVPERWEHSICGHFQDIRALQRAVDKMKDAFTARHGIPFDAEAVVQHRDKHGDRPRPQE